MNIDQVEEDRRLGSDLDPELLHPPLHRVDMVLHHHLAAELSIIKDGLITVETSHTK